MARRRPSPSEEQPLLTSTCPAPSMDNLGYADEESGVAGAQPGGAEAEPGEKPRGRISGARLVMVMCILATELCERLTYYSVVANLVLFCTSVLMYSSTDAATISLVFSGTVYLIPVFGGYVADAYAGKYNAIFGAGLIYCIGLILLPASAINYDALFGNGDISLTARRAFFLLGLVFVAIGTGGIKANVGPFGAEQVKDIGEDAVQTFFNWFYWFINAGSMIAYAGVAYIQQNVSFAWGFFVPLLSMMIALVIFMFGRNKYIHTPAGGSILTTAFSVCYTGALSTKHANPAGKASKEVLYGARVKYGGKYDDYTVEGVACVLRVIPVFILIIMYWAIYSQMQSTFFLQSEVMDLRIGDGQVPAAALNVFNTVFILLLIPVVDRFIYPFFQRIGRPLTHLQRMGIGMVLAAVSVVVGGVVEIYRKKELAESGGFTQTLNDQKFNSSYFSVFLQVPQFGLVGTSEVFASISGLEFAYTQAPPSMQGLLMGLFFVASGLGSYVSTAILRIVESATQGHPWVPDDINVGNVEYLFFLLAGLMGLNFIVFIFYSSFYKYRDTTQSTEDTKENGYSGDVGMEKEEKQSTKL